MKIKEKLQMDFGGIQKNGPINIVAFGDSVTHGCLGPGEINFETVYWNRLRNKILEIRNFVPVNVINAGIGGANAPGSVKRLDRQVLTHLPDLVTICFGLNDVNGPLEDYLSALQTIFDRCRAGGADVIFMTPNMLNTYVSDDPQLSENLKEYAARTAEYQNNGRMDRYMKAAAELALDSHVTLCDCYSQWKNLSRTEDTTRLLANRINHPIAEMHELFAQSLFDVIFKE